MKMFSCTAVILLSSAAFSAAPQLMAWNQANQYADGTAYAIEFNPLPGGLVSLQPDFRYDYAQDPVEVAAASPWYWTHASPPVQPTFAPANPALQVTGPALVAVGDFIYSIGGVAGTGVAAATTSNVWFTEVVGGVMQGWQLSAWRFGQVLGGSTGVPVCHTRAVAVGNRIYVAGGSTKNYGVPPYAGEQETTSAVYSAPVNRVTGEVGPWVSEPSLLKSVAGHGFVHSAGALFVMGGIEKLPGNVLAPHQWVQKSEVRPDGRLSSWESIRQIPAGVSSPACTGTPGPGWAEIGSFSVGRTIGFFGGMLSLSTGGSCPYFNHAYYAYLDSNNRIAEWVQLSSATEKGRPGSSPQVYNGSIVSAGGNSPGGFPLQNVSFDPAGGAPGIIRDASSGYDSTEIRPNYADLLVRPSLSGPEFPVPGTPMPAVMVRNHIFVAGLGGLSASANVYRTTMAPAADRVGAAYYLSAPKDLGGIYRLRNVRWTFIKNGAGTAANPDDWAMVRYRLADESMKWTAWTPRTPEAGNMPLMPGNYAYSHILPDGTETPRSSPFWMPLIATNFRYIQFEVSLYKDPATANIPGFTGFEIEYGDPPPENSLNKLVEVFPVPASTEITLRFRVVPEGAEVKVRLFNMAGEPVTGENFVYTTGGIKSVSLPLSGFANGTYIVLVTAESAKGGDGGLLEGGVRQSQARSKIVVRRKK